MVLVNKTAFLTEAPIRISDLNHTAIRDPEQIMVITINEADTTVIVRLLFAKLIQKFSSFRELR